MPWEMKAALPLIFLAVWLVVFAFAVALCRAAASGDVALIETIQEGQGVEPERVA
jgi:hypothetical protein